MRKARELLPFCVAAILTGGPVSAGGVDLLSHRALYRLSLAGSTTSTGVAAVRGALGLEWQASCEGWISAQHLFFVGATEEGEDLGMDVRFSSFESRDNTELRFNVRSFDGPYLNEEFQGRALLGAVGSTGEAHFSAPDGLTVDLPQGTVFPTEHIRRLIDAARAGETIVTHEVFDGSGPDALTHVTAVIGQVQRVASGLDTERRWPVSLAYYGAGKEELLPDFEISFELAENGVLRNVMLDYGEFALKAELETFEPLSAPAECD
jgi:hypothetical protein